MRLDKFTGPRNRQERESAIGIVVAVWASQDSSAAIAWIKQLPRSPFRNQILNSVLMPLNATDLPAASAWATAFTDDTRQRALGSVIQQWAQNDPTAAGQWLAALPDDRAK